MTKGVTDAIGVVLVVALALSASVEFLRHPRVLQYTGSLGIPPRTVPVLGAIKTVAVLGLVFAVNMRLEELTGACLVLYFTVAVVAHVRAKQPLLWAVPAAALAVLSAAYVAGLLAQ